jgi:2-polyprenyl-3-methyl-5-hydroxy-6-metoxy-1,4-benzoquinol methylase
MRTLTQPRTDHPEILDDRALDPRVVQRSMRDVELSNRLFGGARAVLRELGDHVERLPPHLTLVDVGTGLGDIPAAAARMAVRKGHDVFTIGVDASETLAHASRARLDAVVVADAAALPFRDGAIHVATSSQLLHHFSAPDAVTVVRELTRVASRLVIVSDIRRSRIAAAGLWLASFVLRFHPISRHDGVASVRRGFTPFELAALAEHALGRAVAVRRSIGFRVTANWSPR